MITKWSTEDVYKLVSHLILTCDYYEIVFLDLEVRSQRVLNVAYVCAK